MSDLYFSYNGDLVISPNKDIAKIESMSEKDVQQIYLRLMTEPSDFVVYPLVGCDLSILKGMPQSKSTGDLGKRIIRESLENESYGGIFRGRQISIEAVPVSETKIRFDVHIEDNSVEPITLSVMQEI